MDNLQDRSDNADWLLVAEPNVCSRKDAENRRGRASATEDGNG